MEGIVADEVLRGWP